MATESDDEPPLDATGADLWLLANHDFRQPAQTLAFLAESVAGASTKTERQELSASLNLLAAGLERMVDAITHAARYEAGLLRPSFSSGSLSATLAPLVEELAPLAREKARRVEMASLDLAVEADHDLLQRIVHGMLLYAIKYAESAEITLKARSRRAGVILEVGYEGPNPGDALRKMAFVEMPPVHVSPDIPIVGLGPALAARLGRHAGIVVETGFDGAGRMLLVLVMRKAKRA